ncbi:Methionine aminopeptidase [Geodia barretti]|uniref:Methionine aminopeptidase n=1 Tax=Geodia barretti TaxID=519541 RepID=A0AA35SB15_GEOBA|nr:Methionine aminopeptidase [Geodia barretti]
MNRKGKVDTASNSASPYTGGITIKSAQELDAMRHAGAIVGATLTLLKRSVESGITTRELDNIAFKEITSHGAKPTFKGYRGFPASICASVNEEIVHGIPGKRVLKEGDIIKMDVGATIDGFIGDAAVSVPVGTVTQEAIDLMEATRLSLEEGIKASQPGNRIGDIVAPPCRPIARPEAMASCASLLVTEWDGSCMRTPNVPNYGQAGRGQLLRAGMCIAIEPMLNVGDWHTRILDDNWTVVTADGSLSSHFEHTIAITEDGPEILTKHT